VTKFLWDTVHALPQLALERDGAGALLRRYVYGHRRISMTTGGNLYYYHYENVGSVANLTSSNGTTQWSYEYEPFGAIRTETQEDPAAPQNPLKFTGELADPTGLYYLRARQYDPASSRFTTPDPVTTSRSEPFVARYVYAADRPTAFVDPSGTTRIPADDGQLAVLRVEESEEPACALTPTIIASMLCA
jgi:RHS repeat-associated protein